MTKWQAILKALPWKIIFPVVLFLVVVLSAFTIRSSHYRKEARKIRAVIGADFVPFTVESSMMYAYSRDVATGRGIPRYDPGLVGMEKIPVRDQMTVGLEYFLGYGYRLKKLFCPSTSTPADENYEDDPDFTRWLRFQLRLWTSLTAGFIFLWLIVLRCPWFFALLGGLLHAVAPAAIARYTAQDIVRGEFCLPLIAAAFVLSCWSFRKRGRWRLLLLGVTVFLAIATWDMCQIVFSLWGICEIVRLLIGGVINSKRRNVWRSEERRVGKECRSRW